MRTGRFFRETVRIILRKHFRIDQILTQEKPFYVVHGFILFTILVILVSWYCK